MLQYSILQKFRGFPIIPQQGRIFRPRVHDFLIKLCLAMYYIEKLVKTVWNKQKKDNWLRYLRIYFK